MEGVPDFLPAAVEGSIEALLQSDVEAAIALLRNHPGKEFTFLQSDVVDSLRPSDPRRALALASTLVGDGQESGPLSKATNDWLEEDEATARQWIGEHDGPGRDHARTSLLRHDASRNPAAEVAEFAALRSEGVPYETLEGAVNEIALELGKADPDAARAWLETLPAGAFRDHAVRGLAEIWVWQDPAAASEWIATLPTGAQRDHGAKFLAEAIRTSDPAAALEWARTGSEGDTRRRTIAKVLEEWRRQNRVAAEAAPLGGPEEDRPSGDR